MEKLKLRDLRLQSGMTVRKIAEKLQIAPTTYYSYEQGTREIRISQVLVLSELFDVSEREVIEAQINSRLSCQRYNQRKL